MNEIPTTDDLAQRRMPGKILIYPGAATRLGWLITLGGWLIMLGGLIALGAIVFAVLFAAIPRYFLVLVFAAMAAIPLYYVVLQLPESTRLRITPNGLEVRYCFVEHH